jgi:hypothetical protein
MRHKRYVAAAATAGLLAIGPLSGFASAATASGVGTATVSSTVLGVQLGTNGDLLSIRVLGDDGSATTDPAKGTPVSSETLSPLTISSKTVPALNVSVPSVATTSTGTEDKKSVTPALPNIPAFSGDLSAVLSSIVDATGARSGLQAGLANVSVAGGLLSLPSAVAGASSSSVKTDATGSRNVEIPSIEVLNLAAVLDALGLSLPELPIQDLLDLLAGLGVTVPNVTDPAAAVAALNGAIDLLQGKTGPVTATLCGALDSVLGPIGGVVGSLPVAVPTPDADNPVPDLGDPLSGVLGIAAIDCTSTVATAEALLDQVQDTLANLLTSILNLLADTALLSVQDVNIGILAKAADTVEHSAATVTASIGSVKVGNLAIPAASGLDLTDAAAVLNGATEAVQSAVSGVLGQINAALAGMVDVDVLKITKDVTSANGYTNATSTVTALTATITPPTSALGIAAVPVVGTPVSTVLGSLGAAVPALSPLMTQLEAALGGLEALTGPSTVTAASLSSSGSFKAIGAGTTPGGDLPRTGRNAALPAMFAVALAGAAIAIRRVLRVVDA